MDHGLYVVATPIGNLLDITIRALDVLAGADLILAEDTRVTRVLLERYGITTPLKAYHDHNAQQMRPQILDRLAQGDIIAQVSDAGTPLISDPGYKLVSEALDAGFKVVPIPGPSAMLAALVAAGRSTDAIHFAGFLPQKGAAREAKLSELKAVEATLVFYEAPGRVAAFLDSAAKVLGPRHGAVCRELTKRYEEVQRGPLTALAQWAKDSGLKGECVVVIDGPSEQAPADIDVDDALIGALQTHSLKDAVTLVAGASGVPRKQVYQRALALSQKTGD